MTREQNAFYCVTKVRTEPYNSKGTLWVRFTSTHRLHLTWLERAVLTSNLYMVFPLNALK